MKKLFTKLNSKFLLAPIIVFVFFVPNILFSKIPIPADALLGLYHPWRDNSYQNFNPNKFPVKNPLITDPILQTLPWKMITINNFKNLNFPLWNPYSFSGQPLLANIQSAPFQITNVFYLLFTYKVAWAFQIILPSILTCIFMYIFLKNKGLSHYASSFGAIVLPFSGFFTAWLTWGTVISTAMWLPLILFTLDKLAQKISPFYYLILTLALFQTIVSGHIQTAVYVILTSLLYLIFIVIKNNNPKLVIFTILSVTLAFFISAPQLLPSIEFSSFSNRQLDQNFWPGRQDWFLPVQHLIQLLAPDFFGNPTTNNYWGIWNYAEFASFIGLIPLFFVINAFRKIDKNITFFIIIIVITLVFALENPISKLPYIYTIPIISSFQPSRILFLLDFSLAVLASYGFEQFIKQKYSKFSFVASLSIICIFILLIALAIFGKELFPKLININSTSVASRNLYIPILFSSLILFIVLLKKIEFPQKILIIIIFSLTIFELFKFSYKFTPFVNTSLIYPHTKITEFLQSQQKPFRVLATDRRIANPNSLTAYGIESVSGYDPLYLKNYAIFVNSWQNNRAEDSAAFNRFITPDKFLNPLTNLLNIDYLLTFDEIKDKNFQKILEEGTTKLYFNTQALPRAFFPQKVLKLESDRDILSKITDPNANFKKTSYSRDFESLNSNVIATSQFLNYSDQNITIKTSSNVSSPIIISNIYYPGWKAFIDKSLVPIKKINYIFQTVNIPEGEHILELKYQPTSFYKGTYLSILGTIAMIIVSLYIWHKKYQ